MKIVGSNGINNCNISITPPPPIDFFPKQEKKKKKKEETDGNQESTNKNEKIEEHASCENTFLLLHY